MEYAGETAYQYARPNPMSRGWMRFAFVFFVGGTFVTGLWVLLAGAPLVDALILEGFWVAFPLVMWLRYGVLNFRFGARVVVTPSLLTIKYWGWKCESPWQDVASVSLETPGDVEGLTGLWSRLLLGRDARIPCVKVALKRVPRASPLNLIFGEPKMGTRTWGIGIPGTRILRLYLEKPEEFVRDVRQFLTPDLSSAAPA